MASNAGAANQRIRERNMTDDTSKVERFEDQLAKLEEIVDRLEDESVGLEEALGLFENGVELARRCRARLQEVEQRVTQLLETDDGEEEAEAAAEEPE
jgi:exodeoxyribonuclease VII small subunit